MNSDLKKQGQALEVKNHITHKHVSAILRSRIYLNEKLNFYHHIIDRNAQINIRPENLFY